MGRLWPDAYRDDEQYLNDWIDRDPELEQVRGRPDPFSNPWDGDLPDPTPVAALTAELTAYLDVGARRRTLKSLDYREEYLHSEHWKMTRRAIIAKRGRYCERCHKAGSVDVHHLTYARLGAERDEDLQVICRACHEKEHDE